MVTTVLTLVLTFVVASMGYVYMFRGQARFADFTEYLRKGWPLFTPLNCMLYLFTEKRANRAIMDLNDFKELEGITKNWQVIREEGLELVKKGYFNTTNNPDSKAYFDIGFRTFYKYGWSKFYLKWYGYTHESAKSLCPKTVELLKKFPTVNGAMFTVLPPGGQLTRHLDPIACSLRYHLGLATPNNDNCFINVDGTKYSWRDGQALIFDETYLHFVKNETTEPRLILMCDIDRPMWGLGSIVNFFYKQLAKLSVVPNLEGDKRGLANIIFSSLSPILAKTKALKQTNRKLYLLIKYSVNTLLIVLVFALIALVLAVVKSVFV
jgi:beta-hydroxylase